MSGGVFADQGMYNTVYNGKVTVTSAGTRKQLSTTATGILYVTVVALAGNTGKMYVGNSTVASSNGLELAAGAGVTITVNDLSKVYVDAASSNDSVTYLAVGR